MKSGRKLSSEERILWGKVAKSAHPLPGRMTDILAFEAAEETRAIEAEAARLDQKRQPQTGPGRKNQQQDPPGPLTKNKPRPPAIHQPLEKPVRKKLAKGRLSIEARIDLHGLYQDEAHDILLGFLARAHERGMRHVLVITGKGSSMGSEGVLRRAVPLWFSKAEFRFLISSWEWAARHHGGEGAMYVRLSRDRMHPGQRR